MKGLVSYIKLTLHGKSLQIYVYKANKTTKMYNV